MRGVSSWLTTFSQYWEDRKLLFVGGVVVRVGSDFLGGMGVPNQLAISKHMSDADRHLFAVVFGQQSSHVHMFAPQLTLKRLRGWTCICAEKVILKQL